ncbi:uncharacterized protein CCR75_005079 [Bremia lactucae]|uniref:Ammonium transporter AmtB-like domain-containing protein n=1 Tax=Bremia lactucae TaxID=4779 RepID=A0A976NZX0_BRELC|nr:hypothetical protein CCR75_005079 [Bremia lactucae]
MIINGDIAAAALWCCLGEDHPDPITLDDVSEIIFYGLNEYLVLKKIQITDAGGSMVIHTLSAFFSLAVTLMLGTPTELELTHNTSCYHSDVFAMIGTLFFWIYWPSFNSALIDTEGFQQERAIMNTVLSIAASCASAFAASKNATLAGGVAMGTRCNLAICSAASITLGLVVGIKSTAGYYYVTPRTEHFLRAHDTCGILNLHGMPGVIGGFAGAIVTFLRPMTSMELVLRASTRRALFGWYQLLAIMSSIGIGTISGFLVGFLIKSKLFSQQKLKFDDEECNV